MHNPPVTDANNLPCVLQTPKVLEGSKGNSASGTFAAANYKTLRMRYNTIVVHVVNTVKTMDASEVLENWSDFESEDSEVSSEESEDEESSVEDPEVPVSSQSWREVPGL